MCFRPAEVTAPQVCPQCGKEIAVIAGIRQEKCPFCGADMPKEDPPASSSPDAPTAPGASSAPTAPKAPAK